MYGEDDGGFLRRETFEVSRSSKGLRGGGLGSPYDTEEPGHFPEDEEPEEPACPFGSDRIED